MNDIEDFIKAKNLLGKNYYNNIDSTKIDFEKTTILFTNILIFIKDNQDIYNNDSKYKSKGVKEKEKESIKQISNT